MRACYNIIFIFFRNQTYPTYMSIKGNILEKFCCKKHKKGFFFLSCLYICTKEIVQYFYFSISKISKNFHDKSTIFF